MSGKALSDLLGIGTQVVLHNEYAQYHLRRYGKVIGHAVLTHGKEPQTVYLVELDKGFYSPEQDVYISVVVCDPHVVQMCAVMD